MEIVLRDYNENTYKNLEILLNSNNRVAIEQPPSTGKSIITLKYIKDHLKDKTLNRVLYITSWNVAALETENKIDKYDIDKDKVDVVSYSTIRTNSYLESIKDKDYDLIVIDEYQHAGAEVTSRKLDDLFNMFPNAKVIGMSATPIRYLDNEKDMSKILFNNVKAVSMSIEEALVKGILPSLEYFTALQNDELIDKIIKNYPYLVEGNSKEVDDLLNKLREYKVNGSKGIRNIVKNNIKPGEKYVVYFSNLEQMELFKKGIRDGSIDWFSDIDTMPNMYDLYYKNSDDVNASNYTEFINTNNGHISLLLNINMATEALHFVNKNNDENVIDGNIILRDTSSPNLFIQMIGRAFTSRNPKIFDFVANIFKDYSIYSFNGELQKVKNGNMNYKNSANIKVLDDVIEVERILARLNKLMKETDWDRKYKIFVELVSPQVLRDYIDFAKSSQKYPDKSFYEFERIYDKNNEIENLCMELDIPDYKLSEMILKQIDDFESGILPIYKIEKLKLIGFFENEERFNDADLLTLDGYFKDTNSTRIYDDDFKNNNWHMKLAKYFVMNYYHRRTNQTYELSDYINEIIVNAIKYVDEHEKINVNALKSHILNKIKEFNNKNTVREYEYLEDSNDSYDINDIIDSIGDRNKLLYNLIYLSIFYPNKYEILCNYYGIKVVNNNIVNIGSTQKSLRQVAEERNVTCEAIRSHVNKSIRILKRDYTDFVKRVIKQEDYVIALLKYINSHAVLSSISSCDSVMDLFNEKKFDIKMISDIKKTLNTVNNSELLEYKDKILNRINDLIRKKYSNIPDYLIELIININQDIQQDTAMLFVNGVYSEALKEKIINYVNRTENELIKQNQNNIIKYIDSVRKNYYKGIEEYKINIINSAAPQFRKKIYDLFVNGNYSLEAASIILSMLTKIQDKEILLHKQDITNLFARMELEYLYGLEDYKVEFIKLAPIRQQDELAQMFINGVLPSNLLFIDQLLRKRKSNLVVQHKEDIKDFIEKLRKNDKNKTRY